jgi:hypothetical protein
MKRDCNESDEVTPLVLWPQPTAPSALATLYTSFTVSHHLFGDCSGSA